MRPNVILTLLAASVVPFYVSMFRYDLGFVLLKAGDVVSCLFLLAVLCLQPGMLKICRERYFYPLYLLVFYIVCHGLMSGNTDASVKEAAQLLFSIITMAAVSACVLKDPNRFLRFFVLFLLVSELHTLVYHFSQGQFLRYKLAGDGKSVFGLLSAVLFLSYLKVRSRSYLILFLLSLMPLVASLERKGISGVVLVVVLGWVVSMFSFVRLRTEVLVWLGLGMCAFCALLMAPMIGSTYEQLVYQDMFMDEAEMLYTSNQHRASLLLNGVDIFLDNPLFGVGADRIAYAMFDYYVDPKLANGTHNFVLDNLIKYGVVGFLLLGLALYWGLKTRLSLRDGSRLSAVFVLYCLYVIFFMSDGQAVIIIFLMAVTVSPVFLIGGRPYR